MRAAGNWVEYRQPIEGDEGGVEWPVGKGPRRVDLGGRAPEEGPCEEVKVWLGNRWPEGWPASTSSWLGERPE